MAEPPATTVIAVFTTVATRGDAVRIAREVVDRGVAACAQISEIESFYRWNGAVQNEVEYRLLLKTTAARYADVEALVRELHPYELPAIHALRFEQVYQPYAEWVESGSGGRLEELPRGASEPAGA
jgi:periplasmic divalent cation tolerance protein